MFLKKLPFKKFVAVVTVAAFTLSAVSSAGLAAPAYSIPAAPSSKIATLTPNDLILPFTLGKITNSVDYSTKKVIVQIQDLHAYPQTQKNIASIISMLDKEYGIANVYIEGAPKGHLSTKWLANAAEKPVKEFLIETMMSGGELSGAEYYSIKSGRTELLKGIENFDAYSGNLLRLGDIGKNNDSVSRLLSLMQEKIDRLGQKNYSADNRKMLSLTKKYKNNKITSEQYINALIKNAQKHGISLTKYPQIASFKQISRLQKETDHKAVQKETAKFLGHLKETLSYNEYGALIELSQSSDTESFFYLKLARFLHDEGGYKNYPNLEKFFASVQLNQKINPVELIRQEDMLVNEIRNKSAKSLPEREILFMERFSSILGALLRNNITFGEYKNYNYSFADFKRTLNKYIIFNELNALESAVNTAEEFYGVNAMRDGYFVEALEGVFTKPSGEISTFSPSQLNNAADMLKNAKTVDIIITGGFHTSGVSRLLENKRQSYIVITPGIMQDIPKSEKAYDAIIKRQASMFSRNAFDIMKKSAIFEISPSIVDPAKAVFTVLFSESTLRKLYENGMLDVKALEAIANEGYGRKAVSITGIEVTRDAVNATVNGKVITVTAAGARYADEIDAALPDTETPPAGKVNKEARENIAVQDAVIGIMLLSAKENVSLREIENAFSALNPYSLPQDVLDALKEIAKKFPAEQKECIETLVTQREAFGGAPVLTRYPAWIEKIRFKPLRSAFKGFYSAVIAPFAEAGDIMAIAAYLNLGRAELKDMIAQAKRKAYAETATEQTGETLSPKERAGEAVRHVIREIIETRLQKGSPRAEFLLSHSNFKGENMPVMADALDSIVASAASFSKVKPLAWAAAIANHMVYNIKALYARTGAELTKDAPGSDAPSLPSIYELMKENGLGAIYDGEGTNFGVYSKNATMMELCLFDDEGKETRIAMTKDEKTDVWSVYLPEIKPGQKYGFRAHGPYDPDNGHYFNPNKLAVDPYSFQQEARFIYDDVLRVCEDGDIYRMDARDSAPVVPKSVVVDLRKLDELQTPQPLAVTEDNSHIYELHVGVFTALKQDLPQAERSTIKGMVSPDILEHLRKIGITIVEVQPIQSDANDRNSHARGLRNNSGYQTVTFCALNPEFGDPARPGEDLLALKETIGKLSSAGMRFGMDVVDNHSGEGSAALDPSLCYRLLDNASYYLLHPDFKSGYDDASGCGNAFNTSSPVVLNLMTKYKEMFALMGVRLFRHDLMAAAARNEVTREYDPDIDYMKIFEESPILSAIDESEGILVTAEGYMATGGARGVPFYFTDRFHEKYATWNSRIRDLARGFIMGRNGPGELASAIADPNYSGNQARQPHVYYIVSHDGHTSAQLMATTWKNNFDNGENNTDGPNEFGMGLGYGDKRRIAMYVGSAMMLLWLFQGPKMFEMGDEFLRTQHDNNNPYNQSYEYLNMRWDVEAVLVPLMHAMSKYRKDHLTLNALSGPPFTGRIVNSAGDKDIRWSHPEGREMVSDDWNSANYLGFMVSGDRLRQMGIYDDDTLVLMNMSDRPIDWRLPGSAGKGPWRVYCSTIDLELSNQGNEVYGDKYLVYPGESVVLYKPRSVESRIKQTVEDLERDLQDELLQTAMTVSYPEFVEKNKICAMKAALRIILLRIRRAGGRNARNDVDTKRRKDAKRFSGKTQRLCTGQ